MTYDERIAKFSKEIKFMEEMYGIPIDEWGDTMTPLHYLDALNLYYKNNIIQ